MNAKRVLLGDMGAGKSSLVLCFVKGKFLDFQESTIGARILLPDPSTERRHREVRDLGYCRPGEVPQPCFHVPSRRRRCHHRLRHHQRGVISRSKELGARVTATRSSHMVTALALNKADLEEKRKVEAEEAQAYAEENCLFFMETSAKTAINVNDIIYEIGLFLKEKKHEAHGETLLHVGCNNFNKQRSQQDPNQGMILNDRPAQQLQTSSCCS